MNVIVSNKQKNIIDNANIDAIKDLNGLFSVDDLVNKFKNYFFSKMILDATSVIDFTSDNVLNRLAKDIGSDRLIILLPASPEPPKEFVDKLISLKIYNFSNKIEDIVKFISYPNNYGDVSSENSLYVDNSIQDNNTMINNIPNNESYSDMLNNFEIEENDGNTSQGDESNNTTDIENSNRNDLSLNVDNDLDYSNDFEVDEGVNNIEPFNDEVVNDRAFNNNINLEAGVNTDLEASINNDIESGVNDNNGLNNSPNDNDITYQGLNKENNEKDVSDTDNSVNFYLNKSLTKMVIGIKNVTLNAGSTTLTYLLTKMLKDKYNKRVSAVEINKNDFKYYQDSTLISVSAGDINNVINNNDEILIVDLNDCHDISFCNEVLYLVEPSIIKLNRLMMENRFAFRELTNKKIILNKSLLSNSDVNALSKEAGVPMFMNIPPINDRVSNQVIEELIKKLNLN